MAPDSIPRWASGGEAVLDHPLPEGFRDHQGLVSHSEQPLRVGVVAGCGRRHDPVDHRRGAADVLGDPRCGLLPLARGQGPAEVIEQPLHHPAVLGEVVARQHGHRPGIRERARLKAAHQLTQDASASGVATPRQCQVVGDCVVRQVERSLVTATVALLGDGQGHDARRGVGQQTHQAIALQRREDHVAHLTYHPRRDLVLTAFEHRVEAVLGSQLVDHGVRSLRDPTDAPAGLVGGEGGILGEDGLVGAVKGADTEVDDADGCRQVGVGREPDPAAGCRKVFSRKTIHGSPICHETNRGPVACSSRFASGCRKKRALPIGSHSEPDDIFEPTAAGSRPAPATPLVAG